MRTLQLFAFVRQNCRLRFLSVVLASFVALGACASAPPLDTAVESASTTTTPMVNPNSGKIEISWLATTMPLDGFFGIGADESSFAVNFSGSDYTITNSFGPTEHERRRVAGRYFTESRFINVDHAPAIGFSEIDVETGQGMDEVVSHVTGGMPPRPASEYVAILAQAGASITAETSLLIAGTIDSDDLAGIASHQLPAGLSVYGAASTVAGNTLIPEQISFEFATEGDKIVSVLTVVSGSTSAGPIEGTWVAKYSPHNAGIEIPDTKKAEEFQAEIDARFDPVNDAYERLDENERNEYEQIITEHQGACRTEQLELYVHQNNEGRDSLADCYENNDMTRAAAIIRKLDLK